MAEFKTNCTRAELVELVTERFITELETMSFVMSKHMNSRALRRAQVEFIINQVIDVLYMDRHDADDIFGPRKP